jgi:hypothetical protein
MVIGSSKALGKKQRVDQVAGQEQRDAGAEQVFEAHGHSSEAVAAAHVDDRDGEERARGDDEQDVEHGNRAIFARSVPDATRRELGVSPSLAIASCMTAQQADCNPQSVFRAPSITRGKQNSFPSIFFRKIGQVEASPE